MASKQISQNDFIVQAVAEAARVATQTMAVASTLKQENTGLKMSGSIMKWPIFNKYEELQNIKLEVRQSNESVEEWIGRLRMAVVKCNCKKIDRQLKTIYTWFK